MTAVRRAGAPDDVYTVALSAIAVSHIAHYLSVIALYRLSVNVFGAETSTCRLTCFLSAALHVISPAGAFLSAPYAEPVFSFLNLAGFYIYSSSLWDRHNGNRATADAKLLLSAMFFTFGTTMRSNGILSGFFFVCDAVSQLHEIWSHGVSVNACLHLATIVVGGCLVGFGMVLPQLIAYMTYCSSGTVSRPWCTWIPPSIYTWVQTYYW